ncbi:MAG: malate dehydrogenase [Nitrospirae bacterium]|nr:MAG: malate dehydrogenase [Nitrospirota bacterium]
MKGRQKISVIGAGSVGGSIVQRLVERNCYEVVLVDIVEGLPQGKALDLVQAGAVCGYEARIRGSNAYSETAGSDVIVVVSGFPRKPGMSRDELLEANTKIVHSVIGEVAPSSPEAILLIVTNPLDVMTYVAYRTSGFPRQRVIGMAGVLDTARFRTFIAQELLVSVQNVHAMVLGGHGDFMVPLVRYTTVAGRPLREWIEEDRITALVQRTRDAGAEILHLLKTGSAYFAPSAAICEMIDAIMADHQKIVPCSMFCDGEYGFKNVCIGLPVKLGTHGIEAVVPLDLTADERDALERSANAVQALCRQVDRLLAIQSRY